MFGEEVIRGICVELFDWRRNISFDILFIDEQSFHRFDDSIYLFIFFFPFLSLRFTLRERLLGSNAYFRIIE